MKVAVQMFKLPHEQTYQLYTERIYMLPTKGNIQSSIHWIIRLYNNIYLKLSYMADSVLDSQFLMKKRKKKDRVPTLLCPIFYGVVY